MILYLSSYRFGDRVERLRDLVTGPRRAAVIANALDFSTDLARKEANVGSVIARIEELGFAASETDLRLFFGNPDGLQHRLEGVGLIWTLGGNSFLLRSAMRQSGLDAFLLGHGESNSSTAASARALWRSRRRSEKSHLVDPPEVIAQLRCMGPRSCGTGWRLCPTASRHTTTRHTPESELIDRAIEYFRNQSMPFKAIRDGEVIIITRAVTDRNLGP